ncbi:MAG: T9SS type A sorting domain-containing protein [Bacteroidota bacterium]
MIGVSSVSRPRGIEINSSKGIDVYDGNEIHFIADQSGSVESGEGRGVLVLASDDILVSDCLIDVDFPSLYGAIHGIQGSASTNLSVCCNDILVSKRGIQLEGMSEDAQLLQNNIGDDNWTTATGLLCPDGTIIGRQVQGGNRWLGSYSVNGAKHDGDLLTEVLASEFIVNTDESPLYPPNAPFGAVVPIQFFRISDGAVIPCNLTNACNVGTPIPQNLSENNQRIITNDFENSTYGAMLNWESKQYLLYNLLRDSNLIGQDSQVDSFFRANRGRNIYELANIQKSLSEAYQTQNSLTDLLYTDNKILDSLFQALNSNRRMYLNTNSNEEKLSLLTEQWLLLTQTEGVRSSIANLNTRLEQRLNSLRQEVRQNSVLVEADNVILAENEKIFHFLYLKYLENPKREFDESERQAILTVANQCPKEGGKFVYSARMLHNILFQAIFWDDEILCDEVEARTAQDNSKLIKDSVLPSFKIYPNPASTFLTIETEREILLPAKFKILSLTGKEILVKELSSKKNYISIQNIPSGIYYCLLTQEDNSTQIQKLIILK